MSLRLIKKYDFAKIYRNAEWQEYQVKFYSALGAYYSEGDYFTDDKTDAIDTAFWHDIQVKKTNGMIEWE